MISYYSKSLRNRSKYYFSIVKKYESSSHIIVPVPISSSVIKDISPKDSPGMKVLSFSKILLFYFDGKQKLHYPLYT